jgi:putative SOS response-associated peptidase YedK
VCAFDYWIRKVEEWEQQRYEWLSERPLPPQEAEVIHFPQKDREITRNEGGEYTVSMASWGLVPHWAEDKKIGRKMYNARSETVDKLSSFEYSFRERRCLLLGTGIGEWADVIEERENRKQTVRFTIDGGAPYAYAGLWTVWYGGPNKDKTISLFGQDEEEPFLSCTMITGKPNELVAAVHSRMPVVLHPKDYETWLDPNATPEQLRALFKPFPADRMELEYVTLPPRGSNKKSESAA